MRAFPSHADSASVTATGHTRVDQDDDLRALLQLLAADGASAPRRRVLERYQRPVAAMEAGDTVWREAGLSDTQRAALRKAPSPQALQWLQAPGHYLIGWHHPDYPPLLRHSPNPPLALFIAGDPTLLMRPGVAVVGSRAASAGGCEHAAHFARGLAAAGLVVGSGLAAGIDAAAHHAALHAGSPTYAVLGCGPDVPYPARHAPLLASVTQAGAVVSEHPPGTQPRREYFPSRNRILAGLTLATLVVEAGDRSGALITARLAADAGREVLAVPGSIRNPLSHGCHRLIRDGALLVTNVDEVLDAVRGSVHYYTQDLHLQLALGAPIAAPSSGPPEAVQPSPMPAGHYKMLWQALGHDPSTMDELHARTGLTVAELSSMLLPMELEGRVVIEHGRYSRKA